MLGLLCRRLARLSITFINFLDNFLCHMLILFVQFTFGKWGRSAEQKTIHEWLTVTSSRNAKWWCSTFYIITAMVGTSVLNLPYSMSHLGWYVLAVAEPHTIEGCRPTPLRRKIIIALDKNIFFMYRYYIFDTPRLLHNLTSLYFDTPLLKFWFRHCVLVYRDLYVHRK